MRLTLLLALFSSSIFWAGQQPHDQPKPDKEVLPLPTKQGLADLKKLVADAVNVGALEFLPRTKSGPSRLLVKDAAKLGKLLDNQRDLLTPALCDALLTTSRSFDQSVLLEAVAKVQKDQRMLAFAALGRAESLEEEGNFPEAVKRYAEAARRFADLSFPTWQATTLSSLARRLNRQGEHNAAREKYLEALQLTEKAHGPNHLQTAVCLSNLGSTESYLNHLPKALDYHFQALKVVEQSPQPPARQLADVHRNIASVYIDQGKAEAGLKHYQLALESTKKIAEPAEREPATARALANVGFAYQHLRQLDKAQKCYEDAVVILEKWYKGPHESTAAVLHNLGAVYLEKGDVPAAIGSLKRSLQIYLDLFGDRSWDVAEGYRQLASAHYRNGDLANAQAYFKQGLRVAELLGGKNHPEVGDNLEGLALVAFQQGDFRQALHLALREQEIRQRFVEARPGALADCWNRLGLVYHALGQEQPALKEFHKALAIWTKMHGDNHQLVASGWHNVGSVLADLDRFEQAGEALRKALAIREKLAPKIDSELVASFNSLGSLSYKQKQYTQALKYHGQAWETLSKMPQTSVFTRVATLQNVGMSYYGLRQWPKAIATFDQALEELRVRPREANPAPDSPQALYGFSPDDLSPSRLTVKVLQQRGAALQHNLGQAAKAKDWFEVSFSYIAAISVLEQLRNQVLVSEESRSEVGEDYADLYSLLIQCYVQMQDLPQNKGQARPVSDELVFKVAELSTARAFLRGLAQSRAEELSGLSQNLRQQRADLDREMQTIDAALGRAQSSPGLERDFKKVAQLMAQRRQCEEKTKDWMKRAKKENPRFASWQFPGACSLAEGRACLSANEVALLFVPGNAISYVILVEPSPPNAAKPEPLPIFPLPPASEIADLLSPLTDGETLNLLSRTRLLGADAYAKLLQPLQARLKNKDLVIVPAGAMCYLPFELLVEQEEDGVQHFLVEKHGIRYAPSLTVLRLVQEWDKQRPQPQFALWAMGDPIYDKQDPRTSDNKDQATANRKSLPGVAQQGFLGNLSLTRLQSSGKEVRALRDLFGTKQAQVLTDAMATEAAVKAASRSGKLAKARYVHFATHGILGLDLGLQPSLVLNLIGNDAEDGLLQLDEVANLKLNADLVVLSACQTGKGQMHNGEGVRGLARAFLYAGSRGVVCSLWSVDDQETANLMVDFYRHLQAGKLAPDALRQAQLSMLHAGKAPLYWAPFILIGE